MGESNTVVSAYMLYTLYRHLQQYCSHPSICIFRVHDGDNSVIQDVSGKKNRSKPTLLKRNITWFRAKRLLFSRKKSP